MNGTRLKVSWTKRDVLRWMVGIFHWILAVILVVYENRGTAAYMQERGFPVELMVAWLIVGGTLLFARHWRSDQFWGITSGLLVYSLWTTGATIEEGYTPVVVLYQLGFWVQLVFVAWIMDE